MWNITTDRHAIVHVTLAGMMDEADVTAFMDALRAAIVRIGQPYRIVVDVNQLVVQTQQVFALIATRMAALPKAEAIAVVSTRPLARMQIKRMFTQDYCRIVSTRSEALGWVIDRHEPDTAPPFIAGAPS